MKCPRCQSDNPDASRFCGNCAAPLGPDGEEDLGPTKTIETPFRRIAKGSLIADKYRLLDVIGRGGMGIVYKAEDTKLKRVVALKFLSPQWTSDPAARERFIHEARAASAPDHDNICTIHEIEETEDGQIYISMAFCEGESLREMIKRGPLEVEEALFIAIQVGQGMAKAHEKGVIHRDLKPANILIRNDGVAKIVDFGLARLAGQARLTREGTISGTIAYMSPEQARGGAVDPRTDIWSLGVVLFEMLSGKLPFKGDGEASLIHSILNDEPEPIAKLRINLPAGLARVIAKALAKNPAERYQTMDELVEDLKAVAEGLKPLRAKPGLFQGRILGVKKIYAFAGLAAFVILAALGLSVLFGLRPSASTPPGKTIAVLPFQNLSGNPDDDFFSDGITEDIITHLSKISGLNVISRTSVMTYKTSPKKIREIARELGATAVLEGSVRRADDRVRVVGKLIDGRTDRHLWGDTYDRQMSDLLEIQNDLARTIARELRVRLSPEEKKRLARRPTENIEAYTLYIQGRERYYLYTAGDNTAAIDLFKKAVEADPGFAEAYAGLADAYAMGWRSFDYPEEVLDEALRLSDKAVALDPNSAEGFKAMGLALESKGDELGGLNAYYKAAELNPNYGPVAGNIGSMNFSRGQFDEALVWLRKAAGLQPNVSRVQANVALQYYSLGFDRQAVSWLDKALALQPQSPFPNLVYANIDLLGGRLGAARGRVRKIMDSSPGDRTVLYNAGFIELVAENWKEAARLFERLVGESGTGGLPYNALAFALIKLGEHARASTIIGETIEGLLSDPDIDVPGSAGRYALAQAYALAGKKDEALASFERALAGGYYDRTIAVDPIFGGMREETRFLAAWKTAEERMDRMRSRVRKLGLDR